jgi:NADPH:quinone reductase-like Zn-dependent oxidoreductase
MKAIVQTEYGSPDVLELKDIDRPVLKDDEALVQVGAASLQAGDLHVMRGLPYMLRIMGFGLFRPKTVVPGFDVAGRVEAVGKDVTRLKAGDEVFGWCKGAFAEYACACEGNFVPKPAELTVEQAAAVTSSAFAALQGLRDGGGVQAGQKVLINGASGGVGTFAVQIAKSFGAVVTGVCSTRHIDVIRSIGADHVVDYTREDFTRGESRYDLILDIAANHTLSACRRALAPTGTYVLIGDSGGRWIGGMSRFLWMLALSPFVSQQLRPFIASPSSDDLRLLKELIEAGNVTPLIDRTYPLNEVPAAIRYLEEGHAQGKVAITVGGGE